MIPTNTQFLRKQSALLLALVTFFIVIGLIFIYSASAVYASERFGVAHYYVKRHLLGITLGIIGLIGARYIPLRFIQNGAPLLFIGSLFLTGLTLLPRFGILIHGSSRWLSLNGFSLQPSELLKIGLILYLAQFVSRKEHRKNRSIAKDYIPLLVILGIPCSILLKQPDFGLTVTLLITAFTMLFIANFHLRAVMVTLATMVPLLISLIIMRPYRLKRILTFLDPWSDPRGAGFQVIQSLIAIGSGNIWGVGIAQSKQKFFYLPMQHTDFIFSIIAEEIGFIGSTVLIVLFLTFLYLGIRIANRLSDRFSLLATTGFVTLITLEAVINIAVATGLAPTKGIGLPFISYGNTALIAHLIMIGLIINMVHTDMTSPQSNAGL